MKYFKYLWIVMMILTILFRANDYEPSYIKRVTIDEPIRLEPQTVTSVNMVYDPIDDVYLTLEEFNKLSIEQLKHFKGIGEVTADSIINHIQENGELLSFHDLTLIKGIGEKKLEGILENSK